jgi:hypothetical protein
MKMLLTVDVPLESFNALVRSGKVSEIIGRGLASIKPETAHFTEQDGKRSGFDVIDLNTPSDVPFFYRAFLSQLPGHL